MCTVNQLLDFLQLVFLYKCFINANTVSVITCYCVDDFSKAFHYILKKKKKL